MSASKIEYPKEYRYPRSFLILRSCSPIALPIFFGYALFAGRAPHDQVKQFWIFFALSIVLAIALEYFYYRMYWAFVLTLKRDSVSWTLPFGEVVECPNSELEITKIEMRLTSMRVTRNGQNRRFVEGTIQNAPELFAELEARSKRS